MGKTKTRERFANEINAGSMADIAFLLLFFFLVTTTILEDKGILVKLPPWSEDPPDITQMCSRIGSLFSLNAVYQLLLRGEQMEIESLRERTKEFILNPQRREDLSESPSRCDHLTEKRQRHKLQDVPWSLQ